MKFVRFRSGLLENFLILLNYFGGPYLLFLDFSNPFRSRISDLEFSAPFCFSFFVVFIIADYFRYVNLFL